MKQDRVLHQDVPNQTARFKLLGHVTRLSATHPWKTLLAGFLFTLVCTTVAIFGLEMKSDRSDLISPDAAFHQRWLQYSSKFRETNELLILLEGEQDLQPSRQWLIRELQARDAFFGDILSQSSLLAYENQQTADTQIDPVRLQNELQLATTIQNSGKTVSPLFAVAGAAYQELQPRFPKAAPSLAVTNRLTHALEKSLIAIEDSYQKYFPENSPKSVRFWDQPNLQPRLGSKNNQEFLSVVPLVDDNPGPNKYQKSLVELNRILQVARSRFPAVTFGLTGIPELEHEEMQRSQSDMAIASVLSFGGVIILLLYGFQGWRLPIACCITLGISMLWTLGFTTLLIGHLNILSMAFAAILVGLGIDFGVHLLTSYLEFRDQNEPMVRSISLASDTVGKSIITAAITTSIAFLCAGLTDFPGVAELGIIAGSGVLMAVLATFLVFPALIVVLDQKKEVMRKPHDTPLNSPRLFSCNGLRKQISNHPLRVATIFLVPVAILCSQAWQFENGTITSRVHYDANLLNMQPDNLPAIKTQQKLSAGNQGDVLYAVTWYASRSEAIQQAEKFRQLPVVSRVMELATQPDADQSVQQLTQLLQTTQQLSSPPIHSLPHNPAQLGLAMEKILEQLSKQQSVTATQIRLQLDHFLEVYSRQPFEVQIQILDSVEQTLVRSLWSEIRLQSVAISSMMKQKQNVSEILKSQFTNPQGDWLLQVYPNQEIWSDENLEQFVSQLRTVDPLVTGTPIQNFEASGQLKQSYTNAAVYAAFAIMLVLLLDVSKMKTSLIAFLLPIPILAFVLMTEMKQGKIIFQDDLLFRLLFYYVGLVTLICLMIERRRCLIGLLAILPPALGALMLLGTMAWFELPFTPANLIALPLVMGIGIDDGVHVVHDFQRSRLRYQISANTWRALVLTSLTSMIGFGSLAVASHKGLAGLGLVVMVGIGSCLLVSIILLPSILCLLNPMNPETKQLVRPITQNEEQNSNQPRLLRSQNNWKC